MRTDDPRRETVVASVREQVALVREIAKATLAEICELSKPKVAERVFELLREGQISSVSQLQEHMKKCAATTKMVEEACETLQCHDFEVSMRVKGLSAALNVERRTSDELRLQIIQKDLQIEQLRQEVEGLGQRKANSLMEQDSGNEAAQGESACRPCGSIETQNAISEALQGKASRISMPSHQQCYETMRREEFEPRRGTRQSSATGEPIEFSLGDYIRTMSLPEVQPFCGRPGECFKRFVSSFNMKYPREQWRDSNRVQLFQSFLRKNALTIFETLPREVREGTYDEVIEAMKARMRIDGNSQRVKALADLRLLAMRPGQSLSEFCFALESLANRAYPDMPPGATSLQKAEILCRQLASWNGSYCLTEALETSTCDEAYEKVKEVALRLGRSLKTEEECRLLNKGKTEIRCRHRTPERRGGSDGDQTLDTSSSGSERAAKPLVGSRPESVHSQKKKGERDPPRCYKCGNMGHLAKVCRSRPNPQQRTPARANAQQRPDVAYASLVEKWVCTSWWESASKTSELFGEKPLAVITLCGIEAKALLDTGSQTTIIPVRLLKKAMDRKVDLDEYIERIPGPNTKVRDASGNMEFFDTIRIAIRLEDQVKAVSAFVGRSPDEVVILGTNALELFNLRPLKGSEAKSEHMAAKRTASVAAEVKNRTYVPAKAVRTLTLTCTRVSAVDSPLLCSRHPVLPDGICGSTETNEVSIPVINHSDEGLVFKKGEVIGEWEDSAWIKPRYIEPERNMLDLDRSVNSGPKESRNDRLMRIIRQQNPLPEEAAAMLKESNDVFALTDAELTQTDLVVHEIDTGVHKPIRQKARPVPTAARKEYYDALRTYVKAEVDLPPLESGAKSRSSRTRLYFKQKKLGEGVLKEKSKATFTPFK
nr:Zinc finger domain containing protein [Haemonchus contortus]